MTDLTDLIARLEKATGPDREIDAALWWALEKPRANRAYFTGAMGLPKPASDMPDDFTSLPRGLGREGVIVLSPKLTESLDAITALIECQDMCFRVEKTPPGGLGYLPENLRAAHAYWVTCGLPGEQEYAYAPTPALALCLALVRAKAAMMEKGNV